MQIDSSIRHGHTCNYEIPSTVERVGLSCYSAAWLRIMTLALDGVAFSKIVYNTAASASDSAISQSVFVGLLFMVSVYRAQKFFIRVPGNEDETIHRGHGFAFLLMKNFSSSATNSGTETTPLMNSF